MIIQFCGLSGSGKTTLAHAARALLSERNMPVQIIDGDEYRRTLCADLGFSRADRNTNIRRLAAEAARHAADGAISIICAINPYEDIRLEIANTYSGVKTVFMDCSLEVLKIRDTKNLYRRALLPDHHPDKISNLTGINDPFEIPANPDLIIRTDKESIETASQKLMSFIISNR